MPREMILEEPEQPRPKRSGVVYDDDTYRELKVGLKIDRELLDEEIIRQSNSFFHASEGATYASARRDKAKYDLEVTVANLDKDVRDQMIADDEKITEAQVKAQITRESDYHAAQGKLLGAALWADRWEALRNAYRQRADMLKLLVSIQQTSYYGDVTGSAERRESIDRFSRARRG